MVCVYIYIYIYIYIYLYLCIYTCLCQCVCNCVCILEKPPSMHKAVRHTFYHHTMLYDTKFRKENILVDLVNYKRFVNIFLSKIFLPKADSSKLNCASKLNNILSL